MRWQLHAPGKKDEAEKKVCRGNEAANERCAWRGLACRKGAEKGVKRVGGGEGLYLRRGQI